ncbi:MAG: hypothetical protein K2L14_05640 [Duncaniella sp.]|nr:hypothetical protein [Duncaniella sp.]
MKLLDLKSLFLTLLGLFTIFTASAVVDVEIVDRCNTVEISGPAADKAIKITALKGDSPASKGVAFVKLPGADEFIVKGFKYIVDGLEEGCFGVIENYYAGGRKYPTAALIVTFSADSDGVSVEYLITSDDDNLYSGSFRLKSVKFSNPLNDKDKAGYIDSDWAGAYTDFGLWLICHVEEYK